MDPYDSLPYESIAFPETHPANLAVLGRLFGLPTADPAACRVLELGCASGGNLIPMAYHLPAARFLGIDLSARQIADGRGLIRRLGLTNIELRQGDIARLGTELGQFDYLIAHGVYSWLPPAVREHLLALAAGLLAPAGVCYLSYNTLPGWRMRGMLRDILLYACRDAEGPGARLAAAEAALARLEAGIGALGTVSARYLVEEIAGLRKAPPNYLLFEYLAEHNHAFLFSDFAADCERQGLKYLCDTELRTLFPSTYGKAVEAALAPIEDGVELEQWLDFITNRNFRQSLACRNDAETEQAIDLDHFATFAFCADLSIAKRPDLRRVKETVFTTPSGVELRVSHPLTKALMPELAAVYPDCLPLAELMPQAARAVATAGGGELASQVNECLAELFSLFAHRAIAARPGSLRVRRGLVERPRASALARAQAEVGARRIATIHHGNLDLDSFATRLLLLLDGSRTLDQVSTELAEELIDGQLAPPPGVAARRWGRERVLARSRASVHTLVGLFARHGVLEPTPVGPRAPA